MLTDTEVSELIITLLDLRKKLLWIIKQVPINEEQRKCIETGKEDLLKINELLEDFGAKLPH